MKEMTEDQKIELLKGATIFDIFLGLMQTKDGAIVLQVNADFIKLTKSQIAQLSESEGFDTVDKNKVNDYYLGGKR